MRLAGTTSIAFPSIQSLMSKRVGPDEQGQLQGALTIFLGITGFIGPLIFTNTFAWSIGDGRWLGIPGLAILLGGGMIAAAFVVALFVARPLASPPAEPAQA